MNVDPARVRAIFLDAVENRPPDAWDRFLDEACTGNSELRRQIACLLDAHRQAGSFLAQGVVAPARKVDGPPVREAPGTVIGPYKLLEPIGEGGMGTVWMARQTEPVKRLVAVKLIKPGMDSRQVLARFEAERQALALMDHPNIAKVLDAGQVGTPDLGPPPQAGGGQDSSLSTCGCGAGRGGGRPYFVMELVKGIPITKYCEEHRLEPRQLLALFLPVCHAVQHAHQKGIIHRDLKPSNVLVAEYDDRPVAKIIDFGVAKAIGSELTEATLFTQFGTVVGTLEYMSPEQAKLNALDIDTRSDIYSLGVLLYELLTGTTPLRRDRLKTAAFDEVLRLIREDEPQKPSTRLSAARSAERRMRRVETVPRPGFPAPRWYELDWIVMKCLEKDRNRRYATANGLALDLQRYLANEPVAACPPSVAYRFRKFARRNRVVLVAAALVALALLTGTAVSAWQAVRAGRAESGALADRDRARRSEGRARQDAAIAEAVNGFLNEDLLAQADPRQTPDRDLKLRAVLDRASRRIEGRFGDQPLVEARLRQTLAATYESLAEYAVAERHAERARVLYQRARGAEHPDTLASMNRLARVLTVQRRYEEARKLFEEVLSLRRRVLGAEHRDTLASMSNLASALWEQGRLDEALKLHRETLEVRRRVLGTRDPDTLASLSILATVLSLQERLDESRQLLEQALPLQRRLLGDAHPDTLSSMHRLAYVLARQGHVDDACSLCKEALETQRRVLGAAHPDTIYSINNLAWLLATSPDVKLRAPARAVELATEVAQMRPDEGNSWNTLGVAHYRAGNWKEAIAALERSMDLSHGVNAYNSFFLAMAHWRLGNAGTSGQESGGDVEKARSREQARHRQEARKSYDDAVAWMEKNHPNDEELNRFWAEAAEVLGIDTPRAKARR